MIDAVHGSDCRVVIIADDLTGANDSGIQIAKRGLETVTLIDPSLAAATRAAGVVLDTESRSLPAALARRAVLAAANAAGQFPGALLYKKIDSLMRGHIGAELAILVEELAPDLVVCAPAYPKNGRTTRDGIQRLRGVPIDRTEAAGDPKNPVHTSLLTAALATGSGPRFRHVGLERLRAGATGKLAAARFLSFDCEEHEDLRRIVRDMHRTGKRILWCGSAGLAEVLMEELFPVRDAGAAGSAAESPPASCGGPVLSVVGSKNDISRRQLKRALAATVARVVHVHLPSLAGSAEKECARLVRTLEEAAVHTDHLILAAPGNGETPSAGLPAGEVADRLAGCLAAAAAGLIRSRNIAGLFLTGGDTAFQVLRAISAWGMRLLAELEPGIPVGTLIGGLLPGLPVVTKAGAFGDEETLVRVVRLLLGAPA